MTLVLDGLFIGTMNDAKSRFFQSQHKISHILCTVPKAEPVYPGRCQWKLIPLSQEGNSDATTWLDVAANFVYNAQENGTGILVHDFKGDSRSVAVLAAYFMKFGNYRYEDALNQIIEKKKNTHLSPIYRKIMKEFENEVQDRKTNNNDNTESNSMMSSKAFTIDSRPKSHYYSRTDLLNNRENKSVNRNYGDDDKFSVNGKGVQRANDEDFDSNKKVGFVQLDDELINDDNATQYSRPSSKFSEVKGITKQKYANIVYYPNKNFLVHNDAGRSKFSTGKFFENCNQFDQNLRKNPTVRYLEYEAPEGAEEQEIKIVKSHRDRVYDKYNPEQWQDQPEISETQSNRSLKLRRGKSHFDRIISVIDKPMKTEYDHEYGGGRQNSDPRRQIDEKWYVPDLEQNKIGSGVNRGIFYKRKGNKMSGFNIDKQNKHINKVYSKMLTRSINGNKKYCPVENSSQVYKTYDESDNVVGNNNWSTKKLKVLPHTYSKNEELLPHDLNVHMSACDTFKQDSTIGQAGGGTKCIKVFSGAIGQRPVAPKTAFMGTQYKRVRYNEEQNPKGYAGKPGEYLMADVRHKNQLAQFEVESNRENSSTHSGFNNRKKTMSLDHMGMHNMNKSTSEQIINKPAAYKINRNENMRNPMTIARPQTSVAVRKDIGQGVKGNKFANFDSRWTRFCRGKLSVKAYLTCNNCNFVLCKQADVIPHTFQWYKGSNQERNQTGFFEDDNDGGQAGTYSRLQPRIDTEPRDCNCVFLKKPEWMRIYRAQNGAHVACPHCKVNVGIVKLSGLKCSCGHWEVPGYQLLRKNVQLNM